jgi:hypothetical protein
MQARFPWARAGRALEDVQGVLARVAQRPKLAGRREARALITRRSRPGTEVPERVTDGPSEPMAEEQK